MELDQRKSTVLLMSIATILVIASDSSIVLSMQQSVFAQISDTQSQSITMDQGSTGTGGNMEKWKYRKY